MKENAKKAEKGRLASSNKTAVEKHFQEGEKVLVYYPPSHFGGNKKFAQKWTDGYAVSRKIGANTYLLKSEEKGKRPTVVHADRMKQRPLELHHHDDDGYSSLDAPSKEEQQDQKEEGSDENSPEIQLRRTYGKNQSQGKSTPTWGCPTRPAFAAATDTNATPTGARLQKRRRRRGTTPTTATTAAPALPTAAPELPTAAAPAATAAAAAQTAIAAQDNAHPPKKREGQQRRRCCEKQQRQQQQHRRPHGQRLPIKVQPQEQE